VYISGGYSVIPRKWEWVQEQCVRRGVKDAAKLAGKIDAVLLDCYDVEHTRDWEVFCERNKMDELGDRDMVFYVVKAIEFCVACQASNMFCWECSFGKECGECNNPNSLYGRFFSEAARGFPFKPIIIGGVREE
jgi:hypothetical protein